MKKEKIKDFVNFLVKINTYVVLKSIKFLNFQLFVKLIFKNILKNFVGFISAQIVPMFLLVLG